MKDFRLRRQVLATVLSISIACSAAGLAEAKKGGHGSHGFRFTLSPAQVAAIYQKLDIADVCQALLAAFSIEKKARKECTNDQYMLPDGKQISLDLSYSSDPGKVRYALLLKGSSELLSNSRPGGSESHKFDILFALDFDSTLYIHIFDTDSRLSPRKPDASSDADYVLMERVYDSRNMDLVRNINNSLIKYLNDTVNLSVESAQAQ